MELNGVRFDATFGGKPLQKAMSQVLEQRMKWLGNSANQSVAAIAITTIKSLRTITRVANPKRQKPDVTADKSLIASCYSVGKQKRPCVRTASGKQRLNVRVIASPDRINLKDK